MQNRPFFPIAAAICLLAGSTSTLHARDDSDPETVKLQLEVQALTALNDLNMLPDQLTSLKGMISDTAGTMSDSSTQVTADYKTALKEARAALLGKDQNKIEKAEDKLDDLIDKQDQDSDPDVNQSDAAKEKGPALLKILSVKQVANYITQNSDGMDDPAKLLIDAVHQSHGSSDDDFDSLRDDTTMQIGMFVDGTHPAKPAQLLGKVTRLLTKAHHLSTDDYKTQQSALEEEARQLVVGLDPIASLRHWMDSELADLLSNPQLGLALADLGVK